MTATQTTPPQTGIAVSTAITAGPNFALLLGSGACNHAEGIVVSTAVQGGGWQLNHAEGIVVSTPITAGGPGVVFQHAEGIVVSTPITAGGPVLQHAEGIVVSTPTTLAA